MRSSLLGQPRFRFAGPIRMSRWIPAYSPPWKWHSP